MTQSFALASDINIARFYWRIFEEIQAAPVPPRSYVLGEILAGMAQQTTEETAATNETDRQVTNKSTSHQMEDVVVTATRTEVEADKAPASVTIITHQDMVYQGNIVISGVSYGNAVVLVQPKRGCAGARCDGEVCKILHDPDIPPPHQYLATYRWIEQEFGAHAAEEKALGEKLAAARERVARVTVDDAELTAIARLSIALGVDGHRADLVMTFALAS